MLFLKGGKFIENFLKIINYKSFNCIIISVILLINLSMNVNGSINNKTDIEYSYNENNLIQNNDNSININDLSVMNYMIGIAKIAIEQNENHLIELSSSLSSSSSSSSSESSSPLSSLTQCQNEFSIFLNAIENRKVWALKLIDSYGNIPKSFNWGNYFWFPSKELCDDLNQPFNMSLSSRYKRTKHPDIMNIKSPYKMQFRMMYFNLTTPYFVDIKLQLENYIHVGLCVPKSCNQHEIIKYTREYFERKLFEPQQLYNIDMKYLGTKVPEFRWSFLLNPGLVMFGMALITVLTFVALAEIIVRLRNRHPDFKKVGSIDESYSTIEQFLLCWSIRDNIVKTLSIENTKNFFPVIAGLRTIVCLWVTLFHVYYYSLYTINNIPLLFSKLENYILQPVLQSCFYVDVFFVISAFLLVYHFLSNTSRIETIKRNCLSSNIKLFLKLVFHRYLRLMPVFFVVMIVSEAMFEFLDMYSPFVMDKYSGLYCRETWWYNFLFINNFLDLKYICTSWSWYLGCEMQFFVIFLFILFVYAKNENYAKYLFTISGIFFTLISFYANYHHGITFQLDVVYSTIEQLYVKPWTRIVPYFGGALMGWIYYKSKLSTEQIKFSKCFLTFYWLLVAITYLFTCEMSYWKNTPSWLVSIIMSFGKLYFGILWGSVIYVCQHGYGGIFTTIMGSKLFLLLNKFCFSVYMIAPILITAIYGLRTESTQFSEVGSATDLIAIISICFTITIALYSLLELPCIKISNKFVLKKN